MGTSPWGWPAKNDFSQHDGIIELFVPGGIDEGDRAPPRPATQIAKQIRMLGDLPPIAALEVLPTAGLVIEPAPERAAWRDVLHPIVDLQFRLANAARPKPVDKDALAVGVRGRFIRSLQPDVARGNHHRSLGADRAAERVTFEKSTKEFIGGHFYVVRKRILPRVIAHFERLATGRPGDDDFGPMLPDGAHNTFRRHNPDVQMFLANPKLGWQSASRSDITPRAIDSVESLRPLMSVARRIKRIVQRI